MGSVRVRIGTAERLQRKGNMGQLEDRVRATQQAASRYIDAAHKWLLTGGGMTNGLKLQQAEEELRKALRALDADRPSGA